MSEKERNLDPNETLRRASKAEYRIGPEWPAWKLRQDITPEQASAAISRISTKAGGSSPRTNEELAAVWDAGATAGAQFQWEYDRTHSTKALRYLDNPYRI